MNLEEAKLRWPLFKIEQAEYKGKTRYHIETSDSSGYSTNDLDGDMGYIDELHAELKLEMDYAVKYPNLQVTKYSVYLRNGTGTSFKKTPTEQELEVLNKLVEKAINDPEHYFFCTECHQAKTKEQYEHTVFYGHYCKECAKKPEIASIIKDSMRPNFYE